MGNTERVTPQSITLEDVMNRSVSLIPDALKIAQTATRIVPDNVTFDIEGEGKESHYLFHTPQGVYREQFIPGTFALTLVKDNRS